MKERKTTVSIKDNQFMINGKYTCPGRYYKRSKIEGLLLFSRMVNGIIDDRNPETRGCWAYSDCHGTPKEIRINLLKLCQFGRNMGY